MTWFDGSDIDIRGMTGKELFKKISDEMWLYDREERLRCPDFIQTAVLINDLDMNIEMHGFYLPGRGHFGAEYMSKIVEAFRAIGDDNDAELFEQSLRRGLLDNELKKNAKSHEEYFRIQDESNKILLELERTMYFKTRFDIWELLYAYLDRHIAEL